jgi:hypothetical protein
MKYLTLIHASEGMWDELSDDERRMIYDRYLAVADEMRAAGALRPHPAREDARRSVRRLPRPQRGLRGERRRALRARRAVRRGAPARAAPPPC